MSDDDRKSRSGVADPPSLPDASYRNVLIALHSVRIAEKSLRVTDGWLKTQGVGQDKQAARLLRFLGFVDGRRKLTNALQTRRSRWEDFRQLVVERTAEGLKAIGVTGDEDFATRSWDLVEATLRQCAALSGRVERSQDSVISCFRALADISEMDEESFQAELQKVASTNSGQAKATAGPAAGGTVSDREFSFPIGSHADGKLVYAKLMFSEPMQPGDLRRLADILTTMDVPAGR
jgi:hypothetical protein